ncbi:MAG: LamG-like jellyroll fold domain-containing protein, partial [Sphingomonadales bacterium]
LEIADLDGDGYLDIIAASRNNNRVDVIKNNFRTGSMISTSFSGVVSFAGPTSSAPYSVVAADLNQDSKPELITANENSNNVSIFNNVGIGSPTDAGTISAFRQLCTLTSLQPSMQNGVVAFYPMCGNLSSASGGSALSGSNTTLTQGPYGYSNTAYSFNGSNSEMSIPYQSWYANLTDNFSFSFWVKNNLAPGHAGAHILWRGNGNLSVGFDSDNKINFARQGQAGLAASLTAISSNWTHVVIVKAGSSNKIYINGVLDVDVNNATGLINSVNDPMIIGRAGFGGNANSYRFDGALSQLMFYNKVLNLAEVNDLYQDEWTNLCVGSTGTLTSTVSGGSWSSSNTGIATINSTTGVVTPITPGSTTITYTMAGSGGCATLTTTRPITISSPTAGTLSGDQFICLTNWTPELTTTKPMTQGWSEVLPSTNTSKQYRMVVNGRWGIANSTAHRDPAYDGINGTPVPNRGCDANWSLNGSCPPPVPNLPSGYSSTNTYTYMLGAGTAAGTTIAFSDGAYGDNVGTLTYQLFSTTANTTTFSSSVTGGVWSSSNNGVAIIHPTTGVVTAVAAGTATMTYTVAATGGCITATATRTVTVSTEVSAGTLTGTQSLCVGSTSTFTSTATGGTWSSSNSAVATINSTTGLVTALTPGTATMTYSVAGTGGCATATATRAVTVTANPTISALSDTTRVCGTSTVLNAGAGYSSYSWNTGAATQTITTTSGGFYKVTVTNAAGCTASDSTFLSLVNANIINNDTTICLG